MFTPKTLRKYHEKYTENVNLFLNFLTHILEECAENVSSFVYFVHLWEQHLHQYIKNYFAGNWFQHIYTLEEVAPDQEVLQAIRVFSENDKNLSRMWSLGFELSQSQSFFSFFLSFFFCVN